MAAHIMDTRLQDCPNCGATATARMVHERYGVQTWWCVVCEHDWTARTVPQEDNEGSVPVRRARWGR